MRTAIAAALVSVWSAPAWACSICHSETALSVRQRFFDQDLATNAAAVAAPVLLLGLIVAIVAAESRPARGALRTTRQGRRR